MPKHEQRVRHDRAGDGSFHQRVLARLQSDDRDHQFGQVSECRVEQATNGITGLRGH